MGIILGFFYYLRGIVFFFVHPSLWKYAFIPAIVAFLSYSGIFSVGQWFYGRYTSEYQMGISRWVAEHLPFLGTLGDKIFLLLLFWLGLVSFIALNLLSRPAQTWLACKTEELLTGKELDCKPQKSLLVRFFGGLFGKIHAFFDFVVLCLVLAIANFIPGPGQIFNALVVCYCITSNAVNPCFQRRSFNYSEKKKILRSHLGFVLSFGFASLLLFLIPPIQKGYFSISFAVLAIPLNIVGGTILSIRELLENPLRQDRNGVH